MKKLFIFLLFFTFSFANINELIYIEAKLYPKIIMLDKSINKKEKITVDVLYDDSHYLIAQKMAKLLRKNGVEVRMDKIPEFSKKADAYILVTKNVSSDFIDKLLKTKRLIFSIYPEMIKNSMISIYIGVKVKPIINPYLIKKALISLNPIILKVAKIYEED